jgi:hypothetical protein
MPPRPLQGLCAIAEPFFMAAFTSVAVTIPRTTNCRGGVTFFLLTGEQSGDILLVSLKKEVVQFHGYRR